MEMPFGKYKGKMMHEIPSSYIRWVSENWENDKVASAADREWQWREKHNKHWEQCADVGSKRQQGGGVKPIENITFDRCAKTQFSPNETVSMA